MKYGRYFVVKFLTGETEVFDDFAGDATIQEIERGGRIVKHTNNAEEARQKAYEVRS